MLQAAVFQYPQVTSIKASVYWNKFCISSRDLTLGPRSSCNAFYLMDSSLDMSFLLSSSGSTNTLLCLLLLKLTTDGGFQEMSPLDENNSILASECQQKTCSFGIVQALFLCWVKKTPPFSVNIATIGSTKGFRFRSPSSVYGYNLRRKKTPALSRLI